jgi:hypothetical protein
LRKLAWKGVSDRTISRLLERPLASVKAKKSRMGYTDVNRSWPPEEIQQLLSMKAQGKHTGEIARALGRSRLAVSSCYFRLSRQSKEKEIKEAS